jgi:SAM-dependent methyltransferase
MPTADRFEFGKDWQSFARRGREKRLRGPAGTSHAVSEWRTSGARISDLGCGSGLSMAAALRLGASQVDGVDIDPDRSKPHAAFFRIGGCARPRHQDGHLT